MSSRRRVTSSVGTASARDFIISICIRIISGMSVISLEDLTPSHLPGDEAQRGIVLGDF